MYPFQRELSDHSSQLKFANPSAPGFARPPEYAGFPPPPGMGM